MIQMEFGDCSRIAEQEAFEEMLASISLSRRQQMKNEKNTLQNRQHLLAGFLLEKLLKEQGIQKPVYGRSPNGKPLLENGLYFSISHSGDQVAVALADAPVGIDLEVFPMTENRQKGIPTVLNSRFIGQNERDFIKEPSDRAGQLYDEMTQERFLKLWTAKEAMAKAADLPLYDVLRETDLTRLDPGDFVLGDGRWRLEYPKKEEAILALVTSFRSIESVALMC